MPSSLNSTETLGCYMQLKESMINHFDNLQMMYVHKKCSMHRLGSIERGKGGGGKCHFYYGRYVHEKVNL